MQNHTQSTAATQTPEDALAQARYVLAKRVEDLRIATKDRDRAGAATLTADSLRWYRSACDWFDTCAAKEQAARRTVIALVAGSRS